MTREEMLTDMIHTYGFENPLTIRFARYCEKFQNDRVVEVAYRTIKEIYPVCDENED